MRRNIRGLWDRTPPALRRPVSIVVRTVSLYNEDSCGTYAAAIAYYAIFSVVPLALVVLSILGLVVDREQIVDFVFDQVPLEESASVQESVDEIVRRAQQVSLASLGLGFVALLWSASGIFAAVRRGLNAASHKKGTRPYWRGKLIDLTLIPSLGILILLSLTLTASVISVVDEVSEIGPFKPHENAVVRVTAFILPAVISFGAFALLYRYVPGTRPRWPEAITGAAAATVMFEIAKNGYALILASLPYESDTAIYTSLGTALSFLFWMFINASILLLGAEFIRALKEDQNMVEPEAEPEPAPAAQRPPLKPAAANRPRQ